MKKPQLTILSFFACLCLLFTACTDQQQEETASESQEALNEFRTYVTEAENRADQEFTEAERNWDQEMADWEASYNEREAKVEGYMEQYDDKTQTEINELKDRYNTAWSKTEENYNAYRQNREMRENLLGIDVKTDEMTEITASNIEAKYEMFVNKVQENAASYSKTQWDHVEGFWSALNSRMTTLENELEENQKNSIEKMKTTYKNIRQKYMTTDNM